MLATALPHSVRFALPALGTERLNSFRDCDSCLIVNPAWPVSIDARAFGEDRSRMGERHRSGDRHAFVSILEQCKRGFAVAKLVGLSAMAGLLAYAIARNALSRLSAHPLVEAALTVGPGLFAFLWLLGDRDAIQGISDLARLPDDADTTSAN